jgi:RHS repeat-associated protein
MPDDTHLSLRYYGGEADQGQMGYYDAASSIIAFGDLMGVFSQTLYGEKAYIQTTVKGVREGSFGIDFILHVGGMLASVITGPASPKEVWQLFKQCVDAWRFLDGKPPKEVARNGDQYGLTNIQGDVRYFTQNVFLTINNDKAAEAIEQFVKKPLESGRSRLELENKELKENVTVTDKEAHAFTNVSSEKIITEQTIDQALTIESAVFVEGNKWRFYDWGTSGTDHGFCNTYDAFGKLKQMTDPNGMRTSYVYTVNYDFLARVTMMTQIPPTGTARTTQYRYNSAGGDLKTVYFADGRTLSYAYNAARQLARVTDNGGNYVAYGYDLKGNRIGENTYNSSNVLARQIDLDYDIRNHLSSINAAGSLTQQVNDALGNLTQQIDPNNNPPTTNNFDALNRLVQTLNSLGGSGSYAYDPNDRLKQVVAPNNATTQYQYDDLGNLLQESSTDRNTTVYTNDNAGNVKTVTDARGIVATYTYDALNRVTSIDYPGTAEDVTYTYDNCTAGCTYDSAGNLKTRTDARGITASYSYDALNRLTTVDYPGSAEDVSYSYDSGANCPAGVGRLCQVVDAAGTTQYGYDAFGNIVLQRNTELGVTYITSYAYDAGNRLASITYPDGRTVTYPRNAGGRISGVTATVNGSNQALVSGRTYRADGLLLTQRYGNGLDETRGYDLQGRLTNQSLGTADTRVSGYDANGNVTSLQNAALTGSYDYDALDRLIQDSITSLPSSGVSLGYDANGNRTSDGGGIYIYQSASNRLSQYHGQAITLDAAGNTINDGTYTYAYNNAGELQSVGQGATTLGSYVYNHQRQRTRKTTASGTTVYHYDIRGNLILETSATGSPQVAYVWADDQPLAQITKSGGTDTLAYLHTDHEGTPRLATGTTKAVVWRLEGRAFGETPPTGSVTVNLRYPGQYYDQETGLYYNWNRYYDPETGRYISSDPIGLKGGLNTYGYVRNNPLRWNDPSGELDPVTVAIILLGIANVTHIGDSLSGPNGNMWGEPRRQDNVCSLGLVLRKIADACVLDRCQRHDNCYAANQCTASSWGSSVLGGTKSCNQCNSGFFK